ncbi:hypothetical protein M0208_01980 [Sphingomonas sp. SUN019]|uniref:DUF6975 family protein n=1 Tax=Sphingomonas sp. SUN019 TaxID=2937788 RepID=UPI002164AACA|nr:hypothetical protein [Sphingomonas sp. SUN019]UVO49346.1 hypothetical protein M0208_01980 [Sphingomonas sp. SUN019]
MATVTIAGRAALSETIVAMVQADGTAAAAWPNALIGPAVALRDLADAVHTLCALHATAPGIVDLARHANGAQPIHDALDAAADAFADERAALVALTAAVGPLPSTPGQAECEAAVLAQRHALTMLARSDRTGCAIGAAAAFLLDWRGIRRILDIATVRAGVEQRADTMPRAEDVTALLVDLAPSPATERAIAFGVQQLLAQHRGVWQLLDARASARRDR